MTGTGLTTSLKPGTVLREQPDQRETIKHICQLLRLTAKLYQVPGFDEVSCILLAEWIMEAYPVESIESVTRVLSHPPAIFDEYGKQIKNWRLTPDTVQSWMSAQIEIDAAQREREVAAFKAKEIAPLKPEEIQEITPETQSAIDRYQKQLAEGDKKTTYWKSVKPDEAKKEGQVKPKHKTASAYIPDPSLVLKKELHIQYIRENYDAITAKPKPNWVEEREWIKLKMK